MKSTVHDGLLMHGAWCHITHPEDDRRTCCDLWDKQQAKRDKEAIVSKRGVPTDRLATDLADLLDETLKDTSARPMMTKGGQAA